MRITRREFVIGGTSALGMVAFPALAKYSAPLPPDALFSGSKPDKSFSILNRISYGATPAEQEQLARIGLKKYLEYQLNPTPGKDNTSNEKISKATLHIEYKAKELNSPSVI